MGCRNQAGDRLNPKKEKKTPLLHLNKKGQKGFETVGFGSKWERRRGRTLSWFEKWSDIDEEKRAQRGKNLSGRR